MSDGANLSIAAIAIALVALVVALGQLLGQYFATADGYRRCQSSVMGPWARYTRLRWRWSQFRFETFFTTPQIVFLLDDRVPNRSGGPVSSMQGVSMISSREDIPREIRDLFTLGQHGKKDEDLVCWLSLLQSLYLNRRKLEHFGCYSRSRQQLFIPDPFGPAIKLRERSWDFMPPEMVRPVAVTSVSDIAIIARRLGMRWSDFRPEENTMRAEGNGHVLNSTLVRSIGIILQYMEVGDPFSLPKEELYIPTRQADGMGFGILPRSNLIYRAPLRIGSIEEILAVMDQIDETGAATKKVRDTHACGKKPFGFSDIIPLVAPMMRSRGSSIIRLPVPADHCDGLLSHKEGFIIFHQRLQDHIKTHQGLYPDKRKWVLTQYEMLSKHPEWESETLANTQGNNRPLPFLDLVQESHDITTEYFLNLQRTNRLRYSYLVDAHLIHAAIHYWGDATQHMRENKARFDPSWMRDWIAEGAHMYWDYLPRVVQAMTGGKTRYEIVRGEEDALVQEAWIVMMFRGLCWWRCHWMEAGEMMMGQGGVGRVSRVPSRYWNSGFQVYVG